MSGNQENAADRNAYFSWIKQYFCIFTMIGWLKSDKTLTWANKIVGIKSDKSEW